MTEQVERRKGVHPREKRALNDRENFVADVTISRVLNRLEIDNLDEYLEERRLMSQWFRTMQELDKANAELKKERADFWKRLKQEGWIEVIKWTAKVVMLSLWGTVFYMLGPTALHMFKNFVAG